jgi:hypothetical protein
MLAWSPVPDGPHLRETRLEYVIERVSPLIAERHGGAPGWHLWRPSDTKEYPGQFGCYLGEDLALAKRLAEARIITGCPTSSTLGQPPSLCTVLRGSLTSEVSVAGTTVLAVVVAVPDRPVIRVHRYDLLADPRTGTGGLLGDIRAQIHRHGDIDTEPVTIDWTARGRRPRRRHASELGRRLHRAGRRAGQHACAGQGRGVLAVRQPRQSPVRSTVAAGQRPDRPAVGEAHGWERARRQRRPARPRRPPSLITVPRDISMSVSPGWEMSARTRFPVGGVDTAGTA